MLLKLHAGGVIALQIRVLDVTITIQRNVYLQEPEITGNFIIPKHFKGYGTKNSLHV